jgi:simple sugar transport system ATP-binding protein
MSTQQQALLEMRSIEKHFGNIIALAGVSFDVRAGECHCLLGDNGAGKSTFIKTMSGVHPPSKGTMLVGGQPVTFDSPRAAMSAGIATVFQDLAMIPLMSVTRNFWMGREPTRGWGPWASACASPTRPSARCRAASARPWRSRGRSTSAPRC